MSDRARRRHRTKVRVARGGGVTRWFARCTTRTWESDLTTIETIAERAADKHRELSA